MLPAAVGRVGDDGGDGLAGDGVDSREPAFGNEFGAVRSPGTGVGVDVSPGDIDKL